VLSPFRRVGGVAPIDDPFGNTDHNRRYDLAAIDLITRHTRFPSLSLWQLSLLVITLLGAGRSIGAGERLS
jgi:hypothetical protein